MRLEKEQALAAEARIRDSILRKGRGEQWRYEGRAADVARVRRWRKERGETLAGTLAGGGGYSYGRM
jgi:hypothetical protein